MVRVCTLLSSIVSTIFLKKNGKKMVGVAASLLMQQAGQIQADNAAEKQQDYSKEIMGIQSRYNKESMDYAQHLNKEMFDYTGPEKRVEQLKKAGLNPGLIYGMGGAGGSTSGSQSGMGISGASAPNMAGFQQNKIASMGMGLQLAKLASEIKVNESVAKSNEANAQLTAGAKTEQTQAQTQSIQESVKLIEQQVQTETVRREALNINNDVTEIEREIKTATKEQEIGKVAYLLQSAMYSAFKLNEEWKSANIERKIKQETQPAVIENINMLAEKTATEILVNRSNATMTQEKAKQIVAQIKQEYEKLQQNKTGQQQRWYEIEQMVANVLRNNNAAMDRQELQSFTQIFSTMLNTGTRMMDK